jgi:DNA-binding MarR family transcriptional regulator
MKLQTQLEAALMHGLNMRQLVSLLIIRDSGEVNATTISKRLGIASASVTIILDKLEGMQFIHRTRTQRDRRAIRIRLTQLGTAALNAIDHAQA